MMSNVHTIIQYICIAAIPLIFAITLHEAAHGWIASKLGDQTASIQGRVSLNPARHIDPFGTIILPILLLSLGGFIFGWAKPVPIAWQNLRHPRRDMALVAIAGPGANLFMALFWALVAKLSLLFFYPSNAASWLQTTLTFLQYVARFGIMINCVLLVINLIPIPPLDGSRVVSSILPPHFAKKYNRVEPYGIWIFLGLLFALYFTNSTGVLLAPIYGLIGAILHLFSLGV